LGQHREVADELMVEVGELQEGLHISLIFWGRLFSDSRDVMTQSKWLSYYLFSFSFSFSFSFNWETGE